MDFSTKDIRNVAIAGHGQTGKTTLFERILATSKVISKTETVESGKTVSDFSPEEIEHKISIYASMANLNWDGKSMNFWDTPGSSDFVGEVISAFRSSELALMLVDGKSGVQIETIKLWRELDAHHSSRMVFVNRMDDERGDFDAVQKDLHGKFKIQDCPVCIPMGNGSNYKGVIDVLAGKAFFVPQNGKDEEPAEIPAEYKDAYENARGILAGAAAEGDDDLLIKFIDEGELTNEEIVTGLKIALDNNRIVPVLCGAPMLNSGIASLLNFVSLIGPSPEEGRESVVDANGEEQIVKISDQGDFSAQVVKTSSDQFSGKLSYIKIVTGILKADCEVFNLNENRKEKIGKLYRPIGKKLEEIRQASAGDIVVITKVSNLKTGFSISSNSSSPLFGKLRLPQPVYSMAVSASEKKDEDKMNELLARSAEEDSTLQYSYNPETHQNVLSGMGELQINILLKKVQSAVKSKIEISLPRVAYRETIQRKAQAEYTHKKQSGGHGQFGRVVLSIEPLPRGEDYAFTNAVFGGAISKGYIPGVEKGVKEAMENGVLAGYPVVDVASTVLDGKEHPVDSSELAFKIAARNAFRDAMRNAGPILLEPIFNMTIWVETKYLGDIMSDLSGKRGRILGQTPIGDQIEELRAQVPQSEILKYSIDLRAITSGTGSFEAEFDHYDPISGKIAEDVIQSAKEFIKVVNAD